MAVRLFVGNLPYDTTEADLREFFSPVGPLSYVYLPTDRESGKPRGFAFVEFNDRSQAEEAIRRFNNQPFKGRPIAINEARAKENRPASGAPGRPPSSRPASPRNDYLPGPGMLESPRGEGPSRNFGPDATPRRNRKQPNRSWKSEGRPKKPIRERSGGQFFGADEYEDSYDDAHEDDLTEDNFASRADDDEDEDNY